MSYQCGSLLGSIGNLFVGPDTHNVAGPIQQFSDGSGTRKGKWTGGGNIVYYIILVLLLLIVVVVVVVVDGTLVWQVPQGIGPREHLLAQI